MSEERERINQILATESPELFEALSDLGKSAAFPPDIPFQAAQARGKRFNGTIGQITDGRGSGLALEALAEPLVGLGDEARNRGLLYSPVEGLPDLRRQWLEWQRPGADAPASSLPIVTVGLTHGLSLVADLFCGPGGRVLVPAPFWGNYRQAFGLRRGAEVEGVPSYADGRFCAGGLAERIGKLRDPGPVVVILNFPSNPGGYMPPTAERRELVASLLACAEHRTLVVVCDDAYAGLVYDEEIPAGSLFWDLAARHPRLIPVKVDGTTKELLFFGGRVGFLTFPFAPDSGVAAALESKVKCLLRATLGSPVALSQVAVSKALEAPDLVDQIARVRRVLKERLSILRQALQACDPDVLRPLPANAGAFALVELHPRLDAEILRRHLLEEEDVGLVAVGDRYLRIAFCSVEADDLPELVRRLERGAKSLLAAVP